MRSDHGVTFPVASPEKAASQDNKTGRSANLSPWMKGGQPMAILDRASRHGDDPPLLEIGGADDRGRYSLNTEETDDP